MIEHIINNYTIGGVLGIVLVVGITQAIKQYWGVQGRGAVVLSAVVSAAVVALGAIARIWPDLQEIVNSIVVAIVLWLTSAGVYSAGAAVAKGFAKDKNEQA